MLLDLGLGFRRCLGLEVLQAKKHQDENGRKGEHGSGVLPTALLIRVLNFWQKMFLSTFVGELRRWQLCGRLIRKHSFFYRNWRRGTLHGPGGRRYRIERRRMKGMT